MGFRLLSKAGRLVGIALLLVGAAYSSQIAVKSYLREVDPKAAHLADLSDGLAAVNAFAAELTTNPQFIISSRDANAARASFVSRPLNASLLSFYGLRAASIGKSELASAVMASADAASRRDAFSQLWMIEQKSGADDVQGAVSHYNALLSVHPTIQATLIPVLVSAVVYPEVRDAIRPYLNPETRWALPFLDLASQRVEVDQYLELVEPIASRLGGDAYATINVRIIHRLLQSGVDVRAWKLFALFAPDVDLRSFRAFEPGGANLDPKWQPLSWTLTQSDAISAIGVEGRAMDVTVSPMARGLIASRDVSVIPSSKYELGYRLIYELGSPPVSLRWKAYCLAEKEPQAILDRFVSAAAASNPVQLAIEIPAKCGLLRLELRTLGPEGQMSSILKITEIKFTKMN